MKLRHSTRLAFSLFVTTAVAGVLSAPAFAEPVGWNAADWELEDSEFEPESGWHFGKLDNGLRYIVRRNDRPENTALVRMDIAAGSLDERAEERGYAHYVEHMAFNGSTNVPEGEMIKLLERLGLAFGADTNASTGFDRTQYKLDLPRADEELLDTALMLMRETASELDFDEQAVQREKGVILAERRVRNGYALKNTVDSLEFAYPGSLLAGRLPIGTAETLEAADAAALRSFWEREYVPADTVIVVVGDFDPAMVEAKIVERFADWQPASSPDQPPAGPIDPDYRAATDIYLDPALTETIAIARHGPYVDKPDTAAERRAAVLRQVASGALSRRLQRLQRSEDPPFRGVGLSTSDAFEAGRTTTLSVASEEGRWRRALDVAVEEYRRALTHGFSKAEIAEQLANMRTGLENAVANAETRSNAALVGQALAVAQGTFVPTAPADALARFETARCRSNLRRGARRPARGQHRARRAADPLLGQDRARGRRSRLARRGRGRLRAPGRSAAGHRRGRVRLYRFRACRRGGRGQPHRRARHPHDPLRQRRHAKPQAHRSGGRPGDGEFQPRRRENARLARRSARGRTDRALHRRRARQAQPRRIAVGPRGPFGRSGLRCGRRDLRRRAPPPPRAISSCSSS
jgi:zinc protease